MISKYQAIQWAEKEFNHYFFLDSNEYKNGFGKDEFDWIIGIGNSIIKKNYLDLKDFKNETDERIFYHFSYDLKNQLEPTLKSNNKESYSTECIHILKPEVIIGRKNGEIFIEKNETHHSKILKEISNTIVETSFKKINNLEPSFTKDAYKNAFDYCFKQLLEGNIYEVNLCQEFKTKNFNSSPIPLFRAINNNALSPFSCIYKTNDQYILSFSPERYIYQKGNKILSEPIKGTRKRGITKEKDKSLIQELQTDTKEIAENTMIVDLVRNDLSYFAKKGSVQVDELCKIYTFPHVHQMISTISCELKNTTDFWQAFFKAYPMGSMTGVPKISSMNIIEKAENFKRNSYSGTIGYKKGNSADFNVLIRSLFINTSKQTASLPVGGAITIRSVMEDEYEECLVKIKGINFILEKGGE